MTMIDTPEGIAFVKACSRKAALSLEIQGMKRTNKRGAHTAYSIVKEVYGFRGSRESVLEDLTEYIDAELRLRHLPEGVYTEVSKRTQEMIDHLGEDLTQSNFESTIAWAEERKAISHDMRQAMSDLFYVMIVRQNAGGR